MIRRIVGAIGKAQAKVTNQIIDKLNERRTKKGKAYLMHAEAAIPSIKTLFTRGFAINPNKGGYCSAYATRVAKELFKKEYEYAPAWKLASKNKLVIDSHFDVSTQRGEIGPSQLHSLIKREILKPGMLLGVFFPESRHNQVQRRVTHMMIYMGDNMFWHNYGGINKISLTRIYTEKEKGKRIFYPVQIIDANSTASK